jgi:hypothetical protein
MREKVILLLPLTYNDGSAVAKDVLERILEELFINFHGYTVAGEVEGAYRMSSGSKQVDTCLEVWVASENDQGSLDQLRRMVASFASLLGQETMYFERTGSAVEFIGPNEVMPEEP